MSFDSVQLDIRFEAAKALAREAGALARRRFVDRGSFSVAFKGPQDYLTEVDTEVEKLISTRLNALFPGDGFIGEESGTQPSEAGRPVWVVDPIDGTSNFARAIPHFCVSMAAVVGRDIEIGVIYDPMVEELFAARRGAGATLNGVAMRVSDATDLSRSQVEVGWNVRAGVPKYLALLGRVARVGTSPIRSGSGALGLAYVAAGRHDGYVEYHIKAWDCLAGIALIREAGGYVSDFLAGDGLKSGNPLLAAAPGVKDELWRVAAIEGLVA